VGSWVRKSCVLRAIGSTHKLPSIPRISTIAETFQAAFGLLINRHAALSRFQGVAAVCGAEHKGLQAHVIGRLVSEFKFRDNIRDAADSAQRNFPEGFGRFAPGDFAHFLDNSRASLLEVKNELGVGLDRDYFSAEDVNDATRLVKRALKALSGLQQYLRSPQAKLNAQRARAAHIARRSARASPTN
jgi:four helix bundle protein